MAARYTCIVAMSCPAETSWRTCMGPSSDTDHVWHDQRWIPSLLTLLIGGVVASLGATVSSTLGITIYAEAAGLHAITRNLGALVQTAIAVTQLLPAKITVGGTTGAYS